jgi:hypothetical protein
MEIIIWAVIFFFVYYFLLRPIIQGYKEGSSDKEIPIKLVITTEYKTHGEPPKKREHEDNHDHWEGAFWDVSSPRKISGNLSIEYRDGAGSVTKRDIRLMSYGPWEGGAILWAYCHLRQANRTFRTDRLISCIDLDTGEIIENLDVWLDDKYQSSPDRAIEKIIDEAWDALRVLYYVSKADGRLTQKERAILRDAVRSFNNHPEIDNKRIDEMFDSIDNPTINSFKQAFGRLIKQNIELARKVVAWSEAMVSTEKTIAAAEQEAIDYLKARLAKEGG